MLCVLFFAAFKGKMRALHLPSSQIDVQAGFQRSLNHLGLSDPREELGEAGIVGTRWESVPQRRACGGCWGSEHRFPCSALGTRLTSEENGHMVHLGHQPWHRTYAKGGGGDTSAQLPGTIRHCKGNVG